MPKISVTVQHETPKGAAIQKVKPALEKTATDFQGRDLETTYDENGGTFSFKSMTFTISGTVAVSDQDVVVEVDLPFAAMMFKDRAQKAITKNLTRCFQAE